MKFKFHAQEIGKFGAVKSVTLGLRKSTKVYRKARVTPLLIPTDRGYIEVPTLSRGEFGFICLN